MKNEVLKYTKNFCEENIWHLCQQVNLNSFQKLVIVISNDKKRCPFWSQKNGLLNEPVWWDYHVVLSVKQNSWLIYDFDSILEFPSDFNIYREKTFQHSIKNFLPLFKVFDADFYIASFNSDRSHMMDAKGKWISEPPYWPIIESNRELKLEDILDFTNKTQHKIFNLDEIDMLFIKHDNF
jgi:protein N-terminal glutamine amidohydrolase